MTDKNILQGSELAILYSQGKEAWNFWAKNNPGARVRFSATGFGSAEEFAGYVFPGDVDFYACRFTKDVDFSAAKFYGEAKFSNCIFDYDAVFENAKFEGEVSFFKAKFEGSAEFHNARFAKECSFSNSVFKGTADFTETTFLGITHFLSVRLDGTDGISFGAARFFDEALFQGAKLEGPVNFERAQFLYVPDFRRTNFSAHFTLHEINIYNQKDDTDLGSLEDRFRRLKELAKSAEDHENEISFLKGELESKARFSQKKSEKLWVWGYSTFSDYGRSVIRPFFTLLGNLLGFSFIYWIIALFFPLNPDASFWDSLKVSSAIVIPFGSLSRTVFQKSGPFEQLFGTEPSLLVYFAGAVEGIISIALIFLIGLALRNRFRI